jgi:hypothetical protein
MWATILKFFGGSYVTMALVAALAGLLLTAYVQHKTNHALSMEVTAIKSQLSTAQDANRTDERSILEIQAGLATCTQQFAAAGVASAQAATEAEQTRTRLTQGLAVSRSALKSFQGKPSDAPLLTIDLNSQYPDVASVLRSADANR